MQSKPKIKAIVALNDDTNEMLQLMFERAEITPDELFETAISKWVAYNLDLLSPAEKKKYQQKHVIFG